MTIEQLRDEVVRRGRLAAEKSYARPDQSHKLRGSLAGFDRAAKLPLNREQFEAEIDALERDLRALRVLTQSTGHHTEFWELRCRQAEIHWVFSVLCVAWRRSPSYSGRAVLLYNEIVIQSMKEGR
jgi:hypothetical protein